MAGVFFSYLSLPPALNISKYKNESIKKDSMMTEVNILDSYVIASKNSRHSSVKFSAIATINKEMFIDILRCLRVEARRRRTDNRQSGFPSRQCSSAPAGFGQRFERTIWQHWSIPTPPIISRPGSSWFLPVRSTEINTEVQAILWCYWHP